MNGTEEALGDEAAEKQLRSQARWIYVKSVIAALILTVLSFFFASVLTEAARSSKGLSLEQAADFLIRHGYALLFGWVLLEQMGLPIPAVPLLIAAGALAGAGKMNLTFAVALAFIAVILADLFWYSLGRYRGGRILKLLCRISLEPDSCIRRTENLFVRHGAHSLLVAKFVPGLNTAAPSLAGIFRMPMRRFLIFDSLGGLLWVVTVTLGLDFQRSTRADRGPCTALGRLAGRSPGRKFGSLCFVEVHPAPALPSSAADCAHRSERINGQTHGRRKHFNLGLAPAH
ncbi:MAG TPA: DedA family protein [Candidatus Udaeobacter sp.]|nr:DedA family protein [Candidatus Udaeobacter sp.]